MYQLTCEILISTQSGLLRFDHANSIEVIRSSEKLTDTATITLPRRIRWRGVEKNPIRRLDPVTIYLGYNGNNRLAFKGYVSKVGTRAPMVIECADEMMNLRILAAVKKAYTKTDIKTLLTDQGLTPVVMGVQNIGAFRVECNTIAELLDSLSKQGIRTYFRIGSGTEPTLYSGLIIQPTDLRTFIFDNQKNIVDDTNLEYTNTDSLRIKVKVVSHADENGKSKKTEVTTGDADGEIRTFNVIGMSEAEMKEYASNQYDRLKTSGLEGDISVFGGDLIDKGDYLNIYIDGADGGVYTCSKNEITWGDDGFRQKITIGQRILLQE